MEDIKQNQELQERLGEALKQFGVSAQRLADGLSKCNEALKQYCDSIKNSEVTAEMREKLNKKKAEIVDYTKKTRAYGK